IGQKSHLSGPLNGPGQLPLIFGGRSRHPARQDFAPLADELAQQVHILVVDVLDFVDRKIADLTPLVPTTTRHRNPSFPPGWSVYLEKGRSSSEISIGFPSSAKGSSISLRLLPNGSPPLAALERAPAGSRNWTVSATTSATLIRRPSLFSKLRI